jgi:hypothetical protein
MNSSVSHGSGASLRGTEGCHPTIPIQLTGRRACIRGGPGTVHDYEG